MNIALVLSALFIGIGSNDEVNRERTHRIQPNDVAEIRENETSHGAAVTLVNHFQTAAQQPQRSELRLVGLPQPKRDLANSKETVAIIRFEANEPRVFDADQVVWKTPVVLHGKPNHGQIKAHAQTLTFTSLPKKTEVAEALKSTAPIKLDQAVEQTPQTINIRRLPPLPSVERGGKPSECLAFPEASCK